MLSAKRLPLRKELIGALTFDYLSQKKELKEFYDFFPDKAGYKDAISTIKKSRYDRSLLVNELLLQSKKVKNSSGLTQRNILLLKEENTYTVVTGHQLCLFTGPLYFIYKIFSAINLCEELKKEFPENNFVPVYWMASEDHDAEEINHFNVFGKKIAWQTNGGGSVGDFSTNGLSEISQQLKEVLERTEYGKELTDLFNTAYLEHNNLADATRFLVNELFCEYGLVIIDGNAGSLKSGFVSEFQTDIFEKVPFKKVNETIQQLRSLNYEAQVNPREINCFYIDQGVRARIEENGNIYSVKETDKKFTKDEMEALIKAHPEKISPNVVLRPLYQQRVLPNIAYVGGPGELAYWLEYKTMFAQFGIFFPVLVPRQFVTVVDGAVKEKLKKLSLEAEDLFEPEEQLIKNYLMARSEIKELTGYKAKIDELFTQLKDEAGLYDKSLTNTVDAEKQKTINAIQNIEQKINRSIKQKSETELNQIRTLRAKLFPGNTPQERFDNFSMYYSRYGRKFLSALKQTLKYSDQPHQLTLLTEE